MKRIVLAVVAVMFASVAYAACRTYTVTTPDGRFMVCTECCWAGSCTVTCV